MAYKVDANGNQLPDDESNAQNLDNNQGGSDRPMPYQQPVNESTPPAQKQPATTANGAGMPSQNPTFSQLQQNGEARPNPAPTSDPLAFQGGNGSNADAFLSNAVQGAPPPGGSATGNLAATQGYTATVDPAKQSTTGGTVGGMPPAPLFNPAAQVGNTASQGAPLPYSLPSANDAGMNDGAPAGYHWNEGSGAYVDAGGRQFIGNQTAGNMQEAAAAAAGPQLTDLQKAQNYIGGGGDPRQVAYNYNNVVGADGTNSAVWDPTKAAQSAAGAKDYFAQGQAAQAANLAAQNSQIQAYNAKQSEIDRINQAANAAAIGSRGVPAGQVGSHDGGKTWFYSATGQPINGTSTDNGVTFTGPDGKQFTPTGTGNDATQVNGVARPQDQAISAQTFGSPKPGATGTSPAGTGTTSDQTPAGGSGSPPVGSGTGSTATTGTSSQPGFDILNTLVNGAQGNGAGSAVQNQTQQNTMNLLKNPNVYGQADVQNLYNTLGGQIDDQYKLQQGALGEEMARRGLGNSTNNAGRLNDLNIGQRSAKTQLADSLANQYAQQANSANYNAINAGNQVGTQAQTNSMSWLNNLIGYGQQGFNNDLATNQQNQNANNSYQQFIMNLLGYGQGAGA